MGTTCVRPFSLTPFFSCPPGGSGILPARALRKSARPVALRMSRTAVVVIGLRASENFGRGSRYCYLEKEIATQSTFPASIASGGNEYLPSAGECTRHIPGVAGGTRQLRRLENAYVDHDCRFNFLLRSLQQIFFLPTCESLFFFDRELQHYMSTYICSIYLYLQPSKFFRKFNSFFSHTK